MAFDGTLKFDTSIDKSGFESGISGLGGIAKKGMEAITQAVQSAVSGVAKLGAQALTAYADYEQLTGGVATLFGAQDMRIEEYAQSVGKSVDAVRGEYDKLTAAQDAVMQHAADAYKTAGLSQNEYMETVTSFSAALIASLGGDTAKAAQVADRAIVDMADNANKMGSSMESIQNAYQGFAKQNYTMLDNLKLGYGGTKSEMERLLTDAQKISGIEYSIDSYADVVEAIHVIQDQMGITGTTAKEAAETISGSVAMTKSAFGNLLVGIADDSQDFEKLVDDLISSAMTAAGNILPRVGSIVGGIGKLVQAAGGFVPELVSGITQYLPKVAELALDVVFALCKGLRENAPALADAALQIGAGLLDGFLSISADLLDVGAEMLLALCSGITANLPEITQKAGYIIERLGESLTHNLPIIISAAYGILTALVQTLTQNVGQIVTAAVQIITALATALLKPDSIIKLIVAGIELLKAVANAIVDNLPLLIQTAIALITALCTDLLMPGNILTLIDAAIEILAALIDGIIDNLDDILIACEQIITAIWAELTKPETVQKLLELGGKLLAKLIEGLGQIGGKLAGFAWDLFCEARDTLANIDWASLGISIVEGICSGLFDVDFKLGEFFGDFGDNWLTGIRDVFGIHSPSSVMREQVGRYLAEGVAEGFTDYMPRIEPAALDFVSQIRADAIGFRPSATSTVVNNYAYHTTTGSTAAERPLYNIHAVFEMDGERFAEYTAERVDLMQGEAVTFDERGTAH